ncbi:MAG: hypothetical protein CVV42_17855 [Candidatus Riflebacteria bacterium HGW-Riflebacteria-2]|jgi:hypothetical protein|nr:MAG: hypothetical protein CVV42_17855 [Candidatus Riflebacteria bacterium HGW-Riflebacteria-2]
MRNKISLLVSVFILFILCNAWSATAKGDSQNDNPIKITSSISAVIKHFTQKIPPPKTARKEIIAANIEICFPELSCQTGISVAVNAINKTIQSRLLKVLDGKHPETLQQLMEAFRIDFEKSTKSTPEMPGAWFLKFETTISYYDEDLFCLRILQSVFTGGAHPTSQLTYLVFSIKTGKLYSLTDLINTNSLAKLTKVAENHFRRIRNMKPEETYKQAGYWFENDQFSLNRSFLISKDGLSFCFNQCEIAPYSKGIIEFIVPWSYLKTIADSNGPCGRFIKDEGD